MARKNITKHYRKLQHFDKNDELCSLEIKRVLVGYPILYSFIYLALTQQPLRKDMYMLWCQEDISKTTLLCWIYEREN